MYICPQHPESGPSLSGICPKCAQSAIKAQANAAKNRFRLRVSVCLILISNNKVLLLRRYNTGWQDGMYGLPAGHLDGKESVTDALIRETKEEAGIEIAKQNLRVVHTMHRISSEGAEYIDLFFTAHEWTGSPKNMEADKCDDLSWFPLDALPNNILPSTKQGIKSFRAGIIFSEHGWRNDAD